MTAVHHTLGALTSAYLDVIDPVKVPINFSQQGVSGLYLNSP